MTVQRLATAAVDAAHRLLADAGVEVPGDIGVEAVAARNGACVVYGPMETAAASIVKAGERAIIYVDERTRGTPRARFSIAHELGHLVMHAALDHFGHCDPAEPRRGSAWKAEREANDFATEFLTPSWLASSMCAQTAPSVDDVERFSRRFATSVEMSAIRFAQLASAPCAAVFATDGVVKWCAASARFSGKIARRRRLDARTIAARVAKSPVLANGPREVEGEAWGARSAIVEQVITTTENAALVWLRQV